MEPNERPKRFLVQFAAEITKDELPYILNYLLDSTQIIPRNIKVYPAATLQDREDLKADRDTPF